MRPAHSSLNLVCKIAGSYAIAVLTAGISIGLFSALMLIIQPSGEKSWLATLLGPILLFLVYGVVSAMMIALYTFAPFVLVICSLRFFNRVGWFSHALAGSFVGAVAMSLALRRVPEPVYMWLMPVPGFIVGTVYWAVFRRLSKEPGSPQETIK